MTSWKRIGLKDFEFPKIVKYNKKYLSFEEGAKKEVSLNMVTDITSLPSPKIEDNFTGVGTEFILNVKKNYNAGIDLHIPKDLKIKEPIRLDFYLDEKNNHLVDFNNIYAKENSEITIVIDYKSIDNVEGFHNGFTNIFAEKGSVVNIIKLQRLNSKTLNFDSNFSRVESEAKVNFVSIELGSKLTGFNYTSILEEEKSYSNLSSIYLGDKEMKLDLEYTMIHKGIRSQSNIETRGALLDNARKVFRGNLDFKRGSRSSKGVELENVLLLSPTSKSDSIPALLCEEDNVEGEHAVSAGQIDKSKLFYIMSRGLSEKEAKKLIVESSFKPIIDKIPFEDLRSEINIDIERRLIHG
ncbi:Fe-S cluster assembly protein SufD [Tissierella creatinophila]|uniref:FeS cluster assembly protein SufB n=1 Tax=Tissierella creatinophila DSM 6911 TaxID=1123403 RepID=A0A1U7M8Q4_TISCR|nr:Fe-S cluster assembly protein SufD [Tissierella creatinophila]OLS03666.1 FeS cluster assembly protein SufB [Tissierella creatinophila DSM 6911]